MPWAYIAAVSLGFCFSRASASAMDLAISSRMRFSGFGRGIQLGAAQKGVVAGDEFAFERAVAEHLAEDQRLRQVVVQVRDVGILRDGLFEDGDGLSYSRL